MFKYYCRSILRSFYDPAQYREALINWQGFGGRYMGVLSIFIGLYMTALLAFGMYVFYKNELPSIIQNMPRIEVRNNVVSTQAPQPVLLTNHDQTVTVEIDTIASPVEILDKQSNIVIGKSMVYVRQSNDRYKSFSIEGFENVTITRDTIYQAFKSLYIFLIFTWPIFALGQFLSFLALIVAAALGSYAVTAALREEYDFQTRLRLCALAATPAILASKLMLTIFAHNSSVLFSLLVTLLYVYAMIMMMRRLGSDGKIIAKPH